MDVRVTLIQNVQGYPSDLKVIYLVLGYTNTCLNRTYIPIDKRNERVPMFTFHTKNNPFTNVCNVHSGTV